MSLQVSNRLLQGVLLGLGAPLGWLAWRSLVHGVPLRQEITAHIGLYLYLTIGSMMSFTLFALRLGLSEERLRRMNDDLATLTITDALTGLKNARFFHARLREAIADAARSGSPICLVVFDLDHFKRVNDVHGHPVGDTVLQKLGERLRLAVRDADTVARLGGDEFALILSRTTTVNAVAAAERIRRAVADEPFLTQAGALPLTISLGVACSVDHTPNSQALYVEADQALYRAKKNGRNCVGVHRPLVE